MSRDFKGAFNFELVAISGDILFGGIAVDQTLVNMCDLAGGVYFISVKSEEVVSTLKVIKK